MANKLKVGDKVYYFDSTQLFIRRVTTIIKVGGKYATDNVNNVFVAEYEDNIIIHTTKTLTDGCDLKYLPETKHSMALYLKNELSVIDTLKKAFTEEELAEISNKIQNFLKQQ